MAGPQKQKYNGVSVVTPVGRLSYPVLFTPKLKYQSQTDYEYSCELLFAPGADLSGLQRACDLALAEGYGKDKAKWPKTISYPWSDQQLLIDKAEEKGQSTDHLTSGAMYARFKTNAKSGKPVVCDANKQDIIDSSEVYGGQFGRVKCQIKINPISSKDPVTKKDTTIVYVTPYLQGYQKMKDGDAFGGGRQSAQDMFEPVTDNDTDDLVG